jgi:hypothetical protein
VHDVNVTIHRKITSLDCFAFKWVDTLVSRVKRPFLTCMYPIIWTPVAWHLVAINSCLFLGLKTVDRWSLQLFSRTVRTCF